MDKHEIKESAASIQPQPQTELTSSESRHSVLESPLQSQSTESSRSLSTEPTPSSSTIEALSAPASQPEHKTLGAKIKEEGKEIAAMILYLGIWLPILATMRCLILLQYGINEFKNAYIMAFVSAIALAKVIAVAQKLPLANRMNHLPVLWTSLYKSFFFTVITLVALRVEDKFAHQKIDPNSHFPLAGVICHAIGLFGIFFVMFIYRGLDHELGKGTMHKLLLDPRGKRNS